MAARTNVKDLSTASGASWEFKPEGGKFKSIDVPAGGWRAQGYDCDAGTYRATIRIPRSADGKVVRVAFAAVNFGARVLAGADADNLQVVAEHVNGWWPFSADVTNVCEPGRDMLLVVEVDGRGKFVREGKYTVPQGGTWQPALADGIIRGIALEILPKVYVDDIFVRTFVEADTLQPEVTVCNASDDWVTATLGGRLSAVGSGRRFSYPDLPEITCTLAPGERRAVDVGEIGWGLGPDSYWWPNVPYRKGYTARLHNAAFEVSVDGEATHEASGRFGFREFTTRGCYYYLNGIRCNLRGDNQQEANFGTDGYGVFPGFGPPSKGNPGWPKAVDNLLRANHNVMRIHQVPATEYMLDVCDELGLMIVDETPIRGSEGKEDFVGGRENMLNCAREMVQRDRRHASIVLWSVANEIWGSRGLALGLQAAALAADDTRPIIVDGTGDLGPEIINMEHYTTGCGNPPFKGGTPRADRPYGETESVWPSENSWQGFAWMATCTRLRRLKNNADIRNYVLNNAWSNYVPGQKPSLQHLEKKIKTITWENVVSDYEINPPLTDPWNNKLIRLMQKCFDPISVCDLRYDEENYVSDERGNWPVVKTPLKADIPTDRILCVFNDEFAGETVTVKWETRSGGGKSGKGKLVESGEFTLRIPLGEFRERRIRITPPKRKGDLRLVLRAYKDGELRFTEDQITFKVV